MSSIARRLAGRLPLRYQQQIRRRRFARQLAHGRFRSAEPEFAALERWVRPGDWVLDVGANVGHYASRLSELAGPDGRVIAVEPVAENVEMLAANVALLEHRNVTVLNVAASDASGVVAIAVPRDRDGVPNYYRSSLVAPGAGTATLAIAIDALQIPARVSLVKLDVEGHELAALNGMRRLLERDHPVLIVEGDSAEVASLLASLGYAPEQLAGSPNRVFS